MTVTTKSQYKVILMESRKVQKIGPSSLCISLPKDWTNLVNLQPGDMVNIIQEQDKSLNVSLERFGEKRSDISSINCDEIEEGMLNRRIISSYVTGANQIVLFSSKRLSSKTLGNIRNVVGTLIGANILEETEKKIIVDHFLNERLLDIHELLNKQAINALTMVDEAFNSLLTINPYYAKECIQRERGADSTSFLLSRLVYQAIRDKIKFNTDFNPVSVRVVSRGFERVSDCAEYLAKITISLSEHDIEKYKDHMGVFQQDFDLIQEIFKLATDSINRLELNSANKVCQLRYAFENELWNPRYEINIPHSWAIYSMLSMIAENSASIAREVFNIKGMNYRY